MKLLEASGRSSLNSLSTAISKQTSTMTAATDAMEVEPTAPAAAPDTIEEEQEEEEDVSDLSDLLDQASSLDDSAKIPLLSSILNEPQNRYGPAASSIKERAVYALSRAYCSESRTAEIVSLLTTGSCAVFFASITKAKCAKVVRAVLDIVCSASPTEYDMQAGICRNIIEWCRIQKRSFLRQRVEAKLASVLFHQDKYGEAIHLVDTLLTE